MIVVILYTMKDRLSAKIVAFRQTIRIIPNCFSAITEYREVLIAYSLPLIKLLVDAG